MLIADGKMTKERSHLYINIACTALWYSHIHGYSECGRFFWAYHHIYKWYRVGFMRCYQIFSSLTHAYTQTADCIPFGQPVWLYIYLSAIQQWCKMKMAVGIVVRFFLFWSRHVYTPIVFSRWPYFHKRKIHTFLRKPFCLAYKFFSSFYFIANIVDIEHYTHQAKLSSMFTELDFF